MFRYNNNSKGVGRRGQAKKERKKERKREMWYLIGELVYDINNILFAMLCSLYKQEFRRREKKFWGWGEQV
jgi:hypothetical protein